MRTLLISLIFLLALGAGAAGPTTARADVTPEIYARMTPAGQLMALRIVLQTMRTTTLAMAIHHGLPNVQPTCLAETARVSWRSVRITFGVWLRERPGAAQIPLSIVFQHYLRAVCGGSEWYGMGDVDLTAGGE